MSRVPQIYRFARAIALNNPRTFNTSFTNPRTFNSSRTYSSMTKDPRTFSTSSVMHQPRSLTKMKKLQQDFQCEDGRPVWLKSGFCDRLLYTTTVVACYVGLLMIVFTLYDHIKPQSWKEAQTC